MAYLLFPVMSAMVFRADRRTLTVIAAACLMTILGIFVGSELGWVGSEDYKRGALDLSVAPIPMIRCLVNFLLGLIAWRVYTAPRMQRSVPSPLVELAVAGALVGAFCTRDSDFIINLLFPVLIV